MLFHSLFLYFHLAVFGGLVSFVFHTLPEYMAVLKIFSIGSYEYRVAAKDGVTPEKTSNLKSKRISDVEYLRSGDGLI